MHALVSDPGGDLNTCHSVSRSAAFQFPETVGFHFQYPGSYHQTTIAYFGAQYRACILDPSGFGLLLPGLPADFTTDLPGLGFGQVGLAAFAAKHPLAGNNHFLSRTGFPRLWIYLGTTGIVSQSIMANS